MARDARTEATLDVLQAAVTQWQRPLIHDDLFAWHAALFPTGRSGITHIATGVYRTHAEPMQIVTPRLGKPDVVHYQAPASADVPDHLALLLQWFNQSLGTMDGLVRAAIAHLWFEAVHPFEDGNGRIGRALVELALAQDMQSSQRLFSLSAQLWQDRAGYYAHLQTALAKNRYWAQINVAHPGLTQAQRKALARLFDAQPDGFTGGMSTEKYVNLTGTSRATAYRELTELSELGLVLRTGQGRGTRYQLEV
ncbi:MAG: Fic family protein [Rhodoferax sp.]|nr:Fic family protein [Rhodoferax sp.]